MRAATGVLVPACFSLFLVGCGTIGEPLYPALNIPTRVGDLTAVERGDKIQIRFTIPPLTTEGLAIKNIGSIDLRIGPSDGSAFQVDEWAASAKNITVTAPVEPGPVEASAPAGEFIGKQVVVAVRLSNIRGRLSAWSNLVIVPVETPLPVPTALEATAVAEGVRVAWTAPNENAFRVFRKTGEEKEATVVGTSDKPEYVDSTTEYGKTYEYSVQATHEKAESEIAGPASVTPKDIFPPRVPTGLTASVGVGAVELAWERNSEPDFKQYRVYRSEEGGPFVKIAEGLESPNYSDRKVAAGKHYRYQVTAEDQSTNESKPSDPVEAIVP